MKKDKIKTFSLQFNLMLPLLLSLLFLGNSLAQQDSMKHHQMNDSTMRQHMIHLDSPMVMPFNMNKVTHYFIKKNNGGILIIKVNELKDTSQITLIRDHLKKELELFSNADFRDPKTLHGMNMPGIDILEKSKRKLKVEYKELKDGAQLTFASPDSIIIDAIHQWFDAQLRDHGSDARSHK